MAKDIIKENKGYISPEIVEESIKEIEEVTKTKSVKKSRAKKGA